MTKLRNSDKAALLTDNQVNQELEHIFAKMDNECGEDASLMLQENEYFWEAIRRVQEAQHWKTWSLGVLIGRLRATAIGSFENEFNPKFMKTLVMVGVIGSVLGSVVRAAQRKGVTVPETHEQTLETIQS